jgi:plastocyanin
MNKASVLLVAIALAIFGLAACGDDDDDGGEETAAQETTATQPAGGGGGGGAGGGGGTTLTLASPSDGSLAYDKETLAAKPGSVTINYDNPSSLSHDVVIEDQTGDEVGKTELVSQGQTSVTVDLNRGTYTFFCDVPGHREGGMEGTLTVD